MKIIVERVWGVKVVDDRGEQVWYGDDNHDTKAEAVRDAKRWLCQHPDDDSTPVEIVGVPEVVLHVVNAETFEANVPEGVKLTVYDENNSGDPRESMIRYDADGPVTDIASRDIERWDEEFEASRDPRDEP